VKKLSLIIILNLACNFFICNRIGRKKKRQKKEAKRQKADEMVRQAEEGTLVYQKQSIFGIQLRTNGYGFFYEMAKRKNSRTANIYRIDFTEIKNSKEEKLLGGSFILATRMSMVRSIIFIR
jgi:hypothetical protein